MQDLKVGDTVLWRGSWGADLEKHTVVTALYRVPPTDRHCVVRENAVLSLPWSETQTRDVVVILDNGHWAYGNQISPAVQEVAYA